MVKAAKKDNNEVLPDNFSESQADASALFDAIRAYAQKNQKSMLELVAEYLVDDLPFSIGYAIKEKLEESQPKVAPGEVEYWATFDSGKSDISENFQ